MRRFAAKTRVSVERSRVEIEQVVLRYGAQRFATLVENGRQCIMFEAKERRVLFSVALPDRKDFAVERRAYQRNGRKLTRVFEYTEKQAEARYDKACRQLLRALMLVIKAKLEAVASGITSFEDEFLAHILLPDGKTVGTWLRPQLAEAYATRKMPPMLPATSGRRA